MQDFHGFPPSTVYQGSIVEAGHGTNDPSLIYFLQGIHGSIPFSAAVGTHHQFSIETGQARPPHAWFVVIVGMGNFIIYTYTVIVLYVYCIHNNKNTPGHLTSRNNMKQHVCHMEVYASLVYQRSHPRHNGARDVSGCHQILASLVVFNASQRLGKVIILK